MPDITVSNSIDTFMQSTDQAAMRTNLGLGDAATKNTGSTAGTVAAGDAVVLKSGSTMTGRLNLPALAGQAALNLGGTTTVATPATGDVWIAPDSSLKWQNGATTNTALTGTVAIANGGTGQTTANAAANALLPSQAGNSGKVLSTDGTNTSWTTAGGSGTVTSITAGTGLTGGTITTSGTVAADFGATTGKVTEGGTTVLKTGDTMSGKLNLGNLASTSPLNLGANVNPTPLVNGDVWLNTSNQLTWRGNNGATYPAASTSAINSFIAAQGISASTAGAVLGVTQTTGAGAAISATQSATGTGSGITVDLNNTSSTATAVRITNQGTGASLVVEDQASVDPTPFTISNSGRVGVGVAPDAAVALSVDSTGIKFGDGTIQTTASGGGVAGVSSFSAGTTGLTPSTGTTGAVTLGGTLGVANGGTGATTLTGIVKGNGTSALSAAVAGTDYVAPNGNITGTASNVTGTVAIANGGTGQTTANAALNALLPAQASNNTKLLSTDGTNASWTPAFKFSNTKVVGVDAATIQGCIDLVSSPTALTQVQVLIPPGVYNENLTLKPCVSLASTGLNNGLSSLVRINGTHTITGGTSPGDNIIQLNGLRMDYQASTSPTLTISATGTTPLLVYMQDCMIGNSNASTSSVGVLVNQYCSLRCNNVKSVANSTSGSGGTHIEVNGGTFYGDQFSTEYGTLALRLSGTGGAFKPYAELKQCSLSCTGSNVVDITSTTALFSAGWTGFTNNATTGNGINIAASSVIGVFNSVFVITAGASNYVVTGAFGGVYYSLNNSYSNSTGVPYETKVNANISQFLYSSSTPNAINALTGDVTASGTGSQAASVVRIQGRNVSSTAPTSGQVLAWNGTAWTPTAASGSGTVTSVDVSGGATGLTTSGGPVTSSGTITLAGTLALANGGTGATTQSGAANAVLPSQASNSGKFLTTDGSNVSWATAGGGGGGTPVDRQVFTSSGTWTKPTGAKYIQVTLIGGGAPGGPGMRRVVTPTSALAQGGSGGASGQVMKSQFAASELPSTVSVTIPTVAPKYYPGYLCNSWALTSGIAASTASFGPFIRNSAGTNRGNISYFDSTTTGGASVGFDSNAGSTPGNSPTASGRGSSGGVGGLNTGAGSGVVNCTFGFGTLSTPPITTQPSVTTNFTSPLPTSPMQGTGSFGDNQSSGGACGMSVANTLCLGGSAGDGGGWFPPVNLTSVATTSGSSTVTCASTAGLNVGMAIIPSSGFANPTNRLLYVASITNSTTFVVSSNANATTSGQTALATCGYGGGGGGGGSAQASTPILITGVNLTSGSTTVDCTSTRGVLVGLTIFNNANIPAGTTVASLVSETQFTISAAATGSETAGKLVVAGVGTISGFATTNNSTSATVSSTLGMTWGQALWASNGITPATTDVGYRHVDGVSSATAFTLSTSASATASGLTLYAMNCIGFVAGASTTLGSNIVTVSDTTPLYVGMMVSIVSAANTWSTTAGSTTATLTNPMPNALFNSVTVLGDGVSSRVQTTFTASSGSTSITLGSAATATTTNKPFYYTSPKDEIIFPTASGSRVAMSYARIVSIDSATQVTVDVNALQTVSNQTLAYAFTGGAGGSGGGAAVEVVTYF